MVFFLSLSLSVCLCASLFPCRYVNMFPSQNIFHSFFLFSLSLLSPSLTYSHFLSLKSRFIPSQLFCGKCESEKKFLDQKIIFGRQKKVIFICQKVKESFFGGTKTTQRPSKINIFFYLPQVRLNKLYQS